jgi:hypothetical protein
MDPGHIGQGNDPACRITCRPHAPGKACSHALACDRVFDHVQARRCKRIPETHVVRPCHRDAVRHRLGQALRSLHGHRRAVGQGMQQLVAAKPNGIACREQDRCDLSHSRR